MNNLIVEQLVRDYSRLVFTVCLRMVKDRGEAENLTQDTFLTALEKLPCGTDCKAWLVTVAVNKCRDHLKKSRVKHELLTDQLPEAQDGAATDLQVQESFFILELERACDELSEPYKTVAKLKYIQDKSTAEIAETLGRDERTAWTQVYRARQKLKEKLEEWR